MSFTKALDNTVQEANLKIAGGAVGEDEQILVFEPPMVPFHFIFLQANNFTFQRQGSLRDHRLGLWV